MIITHKFKSLFCACVACEHVYMSNWLLYSIISFCSAVLRWLWWEQLNYYLERREKKNTCQIIDNWLQCKSNSMPLWQFSIYNTIHTIGSFLHDYSKACNYDGEIVVTLKSFSIQIWLRASGRARASERLFVCVCVFLRVKIFPGCACSVFLLFPLARSLH